MLREHFSRFLADPARLHFAAHSHHPWPDVSFQAQQQAWLDAARLIDDKWDHVFAHVYPQAQGHVARALNLPSPASLAFAPNTHELVLRVLSCLPERPRIVTSDAEFHSFERQSRRLEEDGLATVVRVPAEPFQTFPARLLEATRAASTDLLFFSHVFFNSGAVVPALDALVREVPARTTIVIDGYHGYLAVPTDLAPIADRAFYLAGGYKYAMVGEGACFLHVPAGLDLRPRNTGWYAAFGALRERVDRVAYAPGGGRFLGSTFDPTALYRLDAVMRWRDAVGLTPARSLAHVHALHRRFVAGLDGTSLDPADLVVSEANPLHGHFLTFRTERAAAWCDALKRAQVDTDARGDRLRFGFGVYHRDQDVDALLERLGRVRPAG